MTAVALVLALALGAVAFQLARAQTQGTQEPEGLDGVGGDMLHQDLDYYEDGMRKRVGFVTSSMSRANSARSNSRMESQ